MTRADFPFSIKTSRGLAVVRGMVFAGLCLLAQAAHAHPHSWIEVRSTVNLAANGLVTSIQQEWTFDELYTTYVVEEMAGGKKATKAVVQQFAPKVIANLEPFGYFMDVRVDGKPVRLGPVRQYASELRGQRLWLKFVAPLSSPVDPDRHTVRFSVYDPTYYIDMQHRKPEDVSFSGSATPCKAALSRPQPGAALMARAFAMDKDAAVDDTLGQQFAQTVTLSCR